MDKKKLSFLEDENTIYYPNDIKYLMEVEILEYKVIPLDMMYDRVKSNGWKFDYLDGKNTYYARY